MVSACTLASHQYPCENSRTSRITCAGVPCHLVVFVVMYSFDYVDLPRLEVEVSRDIELYKL